MPLDRPSLLPYLAFRMQAAGFRGECPFAVGAIGRLHRASRGIPRLVNILAHKSLLAAYGEGRQTVDARHVKRAVADTEDAGTRRRQWHVPATALGAVLAGLWWALEVWS
ncbi:MAG: hypothetical protein ACLFV0_12040 [Nitriliruptoraceae bacterium]